MDIESLKQEILKLNELSRTHAGYFLWPDQEIQELGAAQDFVQKIEKQSAVRFIEVRGAEDPPDVMLKTLDEKIIGVEVTELVDKKSIEYQIQNDARYSRRVIAWNRDSTQQAVQEIVSRKNQLCSNLPEHYDVVILLIITDEPRLGSDNLNSYIDGFSPEDSSSFNEIYILTGYEAAKGEQCLVRLK